MPLVDPGTRSPGKLVLEYTSDGVEHTTGLHAVSDVDLNDIATIRTDAEQFAGTIKLILHFMATITGWKVTDPGGATLYAAAFSPPVAGIHPDGSDAGHWRSATLTILGKGAAIGVGSASGRTSLRIYTSAAYGLPKGAKYLPLPNDATLNNVLDWLATGTLRWFADFYGQHADPTGRKTVQYNAHTQRIHGS